MPTFTVSSKRMLYSKFAVLILTILLSGRIMLSDPNVLYRYIGTLSFIGFNIRAISLALYIQYRGKTNWSDTIELNDR